MRYRALLLTTTMFGALAAGVPASAQEGIEVVTVTARQRSEVLQNVPVAVTAISASKLEKTFANDLSAISRFAPNVTVIPVGAINRTAAVIYSRGIGYSGIDQAIDPSVGVSVDGLFYPRNLGMMQQMFDASSIEINRGPQGTLYGKNTTGGVIKIATHAPELGVYKLEGTLKIGNYGRSDYGVVVNIPLTDTLAFRLAAQSQFSDGYVRNDYVNPVTNSLPTSRDRWLSGDDIKTYRGSLYWEPNERFDARLTLTYIKDRSDSAGGQNGSYPAFSAASGIGTPNVASPGGIQRGDLLGLPVGTQFGASGRPGYGFPGGPTNPYVVTRNFPNDDRGDNFYGTLNLHWDTPWFAVESITGVQATSQFTYSDFDDTDLQFFETYTKKKHRYFQQEVRLFSNDDENSRFKWQGGIFYSWYYFFVQQDFISSATPLVGNAQQVEGDTQNDWTLAPYFQADYEVIDKLTLTGGIRFSTESKKNNRNFQVTRPLYATPVNQTVGERDWTAFTYYAAARYQLTPDHMVYASFSTGFKSGAFNSRAPNGTTVGLPVNALLGPANPEKAKSFEVGVRTQWFDNRLRANLTGFFAQYRELQTSYFVPLGSGAPQVLANGANQDAKGLELELEAIPFEDLTVSASIGYLDSRYTDFNTNLGGQVYKPLVCNNVLVDHAQYGPCYLVPVRAPQWTMNLNAIYNYHLPRDLGTLTPSVTFGLESSYWGDVNNSSQGYQPTYTQIDGSLTYTDPSERYSVAIWGKNVTSTLKKLSAVPSSNFFTQLYFNEPRTFGVQLKVKFSSDEK